MIFTLYLVLLDFLYSYILELFDYDIDNVLLFKSYVNSCSFDSDGILYDIKQSDHYTSNIFVYLSNFLNKKMFDNIKMFILKYYNIQTDNGIGSNNANDNLKGIQLI